MVTKKINDLVYRIQVRPGLKPKVVHRNRLWKYSGRNLPTWYKQVSGAEQSPTSVESVPDLEETSESDTENSVPDDGNSEQLRRSTCNCRPPARYEASV